MSNDTEKVFNEEIPKDALLDPEKLANYIEIFKNHLITMKGELRKKKREVDGLEGAIELVKEKHDVLIEYKKFTETGGHELLKLVVMQNREHIQDTKRKIWQVFNYKICGKDIQTKQDGWHVCIRKEGHAGRCSMNRRDG